MELEVSTPVSAEAEVKKYTLVGDDIYVKRYTNENIPEWYRNLVSDIIAADPTVQSQEAAIAYLESLAPGYNIAITNLQNRDLQIDTTIESLVTKDGDKTAAIAQLNITKVDATSAAAIAQDTIGAYFAGSESAAWFNNKIGTYASNVAANASNVSTLNAVLGSQSVRIDTVEEVNITQSTALATLDTSLTNVKTVLIPSLQAQIDNVIDTWFYDGVPTVSNDPVNQWADNATKLAHVGDLYYDKVSGYGYRFAYEDIVDDPDMGIVFSWIRISDTDVVLALANAAKAQDTIDGKRTIYGGATIPLPSKVNGSATIYLADGDIWIPSANVGSYIAGEVYRCTNSSSTPTVWVLATRYTQYVTDWITNTYAPAVSSIQTQIDKKAEIFYQSTSPRVSYTNVPDNVTYNSYVGDLWKDTSSDGGHLEYIYTKTANGSNFTYGWIETAIPDIVFDTIDGKASIYTTASLPTSYMVNDLMVVVGSAFNNGTTIYDVGVLLTAITTSISYSASHWAKKINDTEDLDAFVAVVNPKVDALKAQLDGNISYYFQLSTAALPSVAWTTDALKNAHHGDLLYFTDTKVAKRYSAQSNAWYDAADMTEVLAKIATSQATADGKATVYYKTFAEIDLLTNATTGTWTPTQRLDNIGDIWIDSVTEVSKIWNTTAWVNVATVDANTALSKLADLEEARDGNIVTYYTTSAPTADTTTVVSGTTYTTAVVGDATLATWQSLFSALTVKPVAGEQITATTSGSLTGTSRVNAGLYGDYWVDADSWTGTAYVVYRYEALDGSSTGTLAWGVNTGETAVALGKAYRADVAGSAAIIAQAAATNALNTANTASSNATAALNKLTDIASDNILSPVEKSAVILEYSVITAEQAGIDSQATTYGITNEKTTYDTAVSALTTYLGTLTSPVAWNTLTGDTTVVGTAFRSKFSNVYTTRQALLDKVVASAKLLTDTKVKTWYQASEPGYGTSPGSLWTTAEKLDYVGDLWVDIDAGNLTKTWSGTAWVDTTNAQGSQAHTWSATASKLITSPADGSITGWSFGDGTNTKSYFQINATNFKISDGTTGYTPFSIVGTDVVFNGKVSFNSVTDAPPLVAENTNINVTTNLVPNDGWYASGHADYLFVGAPTYYKMIGANTFQEDTLLLSVGDEVYTPYITDFTKSYKISYAFKGELIVALFQIDGTTASNENVVLSGTYDPAKWYVVQALILPNGSTAGTLFGKVQDAVTLNTVATITDKVLAAATDWFCLGFIATADTYISRVNIEVVNTDTVNAIPVTSSNITTALAATSTVIDGARITTGFISADRLDVGSITADKISTTTLSAISANIGTVTAGIIYDSSWNGSTYKMKIDLNAGSIIIK